MLTSFQQSLDRYLTTPPEDRYNDQWWDELMESFSNEFFQNNEEFIVDEDGQCDKWAYRLFENDKMPSEASKIIERAHKIYKL